MEKFVSRSRIKSFPFGQPDKNFVASHKACSFTTPNQPAAYLEHFPVELGEELDRGLLEAAPCAPRVEGPDAPEVVGEEGRVPLVEDPVGAGEDVVKLPLRVADQLVDKVWKQRRQNQITGQARSISNIRSTSQILPLLTNHP